MSMIQDGKGTGAFAGVTPNNRLLTTGIDLSLTEAATETGDTYNINTATVPLTTTGEHALLYLKNHEDTNLIIDTTIVNIKDFVGTAGQPILKIYRNPTGGTIISDAVECEISNRNYGSSKVLDVFCYQGGESKTLTGPSIDIFLPTVAAGTFNSFSTLVVLPKGASIGLAWIPPAGMTSVDIVAAFNVTLNGTQL